MPTDNSVPPSGSGHSVLGSANRKRTLVVAGGVLTLVIGGAAAGMALTSSNGGGSARASRDNVTSSTASSTTVAPTTLAPITVAPTTAAPRLTINGNIAFTDNVGFVGSIEGFNMAPPASGGACAGRDGYADLAAGGSVVIAGPNGAALAVTALRGGQVVDEVHNTQSEIDQRETLINSIFDLRVAKAAGPIEIAQLNLDRADQQISDLKHPGVPQPFEGHAFIAAWCHLPFTTPPLAVARAYSVTVTHRGTTTFATEQIRRDKGQVALIVGT